MLKLTALVVCLIASAYGATTANVGWRIVGGSDAAEGQFPYQVSLRYQGSHTCGGSILDKRTILCAAHCVAGRSASKFSVVTGSTKLSSGGQEYPVASVTAHAEYNSLFIANDISIIKLSEDIVLGSDVQPVKLRQSIIGGNEDCVLSGWGRTSYPGNIPDDLQWIQLKTLDVQECKKIHFFPPIYESEVCTLTKKGEGACHGDSGGPLVDGNGEQIGIVSWGNPCARGKPDVFTRVASFLDWIEKNR